MKLSNIAGILLCCALWSQSVFVFAFETDQYNLPPAPLADIGDEVSDYAEENVRQAIDKINSEIAARQLCLEKNPARKNCGASAAEAAELAELRAADAPIERVFKLLGGGIPPFTNSGTWMESHRFRAQPARYKTSFGDSIFAVFPSNYFTVSATVNLYGSEFGTDKIAHIFQQGYAYYKIYEGAAAKNLTPAEAAQKAVRWGRFTERTYYGTLISGVYSNADLAANYAGMKFYQGLTRDLKIGEKTRPAILSLHNGLWKFNAAADLRENLLKPFISAHLNEARNFSIYTNLFGLRGFVRRKVQNRICPQWRARFPNLAAAELRRETDSLKKWHDEDYGFRENAKFITIADNCFAAPNEKGER